MSITPQLLVTVRSKRRAIPAPTADQGLAQTDGLQGTTPGQFSTSPWEGLYIEPSKESAESMIRGKQPNPELEQFLAGLMYGE
ncbi:hypothetical protein ACIPY0_14665 [Paenarthrobacter nicotinovorans]|uniref:hypothetical protein n=1 Tax=Paenarthrobacter nicotinovorans TaxID=29320 RepID=UPI00380D4347